MLPVHAQLRNRRPVKSNLIEFQTINRSLINKRIIPNHRIEKEKEKDKEQPSRDGNAECGSTVDGEAPASSKQSTGTKGANCSGSVSSSSASKNLVRRIGLLSKIPDSFLIIFFISRLVAVMTVIPTIPKRMKTLKVNPMIQKMRKTMPKTRKMIWTTRAMETRKLRVSTISIAHNHLTEYEFLSKKSDYCLFTIDEVDTEESEDEYPTEFEEDEKFLNGMFEGPGSSSGCTAVVALLKGNDLYVANAGDSRCVVCRDGKAMDMSFDHKPEDKEEFDRIHKAGGHVTEDGRVNGGLNLSRAIGDHAYKTVN